MNIKVISRNVGAALLVSSLFMLLSAGVSVLKGNDSALAALLISFTLTFVVGLFPFIFVSKPERITLQDGYMIVFLSWLLSFIFGMLPYALWGGPFTVVDAWFESVSGFTTTGATILDNIEALPDSLLFWRSSTHFIGGLGVVVFLLLVIPGSSPVKSKLTNMELSSLSKDGYRVRAGKTVFVFAYVYIGIFFLAFVSYMIAGMSPFDAVNHAMSVCATGGFSTKNMSIGSFNSPAITILTIIFMYLASIHFGLVFLSVVNKTLKPLNNQILKYYTTILVVGSVVLSIIIKQEHFATSWGKAFLDGTFQIFSYASTTGFATADNLHWPLLANMILIFFGFHCGMAGSTTGGLKADRVLVLFKSIRRQVRLSLRPATIEEIRIGKNVLRDEDVHPQILYVALFFLVFVLSLILCLMSGSGSDNALAGTIASLSNLGPAYGTIGTFGNFGGEPTWSKIVFTMDMFLGRVEIYPILAVFMMIMERKRK